MSIGSFFGKLGKGALGAAGAIGAPFTGGASLIPMIASTGLGVLGNVMQAKAYNQPEEWRQKLIEEELQRRNAYERAAIPSLMGALGYRSPQAAQQLTGQLGKYR